jgi:hypothetical protein
MHNVLMTFSLLYLYNIELNIGYYFYFSAKIVPTSCKVSHSAEIPSRHGELEEFHQCLQFLPTPAQKQRSPQ